MSNARILCVDDEPKVLEAFQRQHFDEYELETAPGGQEGLEAIAAQGPFAVIVSDMRMPGMDGVQFLSKVKERAPDSVRIMLTGFADLQTAVEAVNEGNIFRFLTKPCPPEMLAKALGAGIEQHRLIVAEKELLEKTLSGAIRVLIEVLSLTNPTAFGHASRVQRLVREICRQMKIERSWQLEIAAMLSQIGCVTVPSETLDKVYHGFPLQSEETQMLAEHPGIGRELVGKIPRLEEVARVIAYQQKCYDGSGVPADKLAGSDIPLGARILKAAIDYDTRKWGGCSDFDAVVALREHAHWYDPDVLNALETVSGFDASFAVREFTLRELPMHTIIAEDITTPEGALIVGKGQEVTPSLHQRLVNFARRRGLADRLCVRVRVRVNRASRAMVGS